MAMRSRMFVPGAVLVDAGPQASVLVGIPPCLKQFLRQHIDPPTTFVVPDTFHRHGIAQVALEFFLYHFLFVRGKAFGKLPEDARLVVIGTTAQLVRARALVAHALAGSSPEEMATWTDDDGRAAMTPETIALLRRYRAWFAPKRPGFRATGDAAAQLVQHEAAMWTQEELIEWRAYDDHGCAVLTPGVIITHCGNDRCTVVDASGEPLSIDLGDAAGQLAALIALHPKAAPRAAEVFGVHCLGSDSGFEPEHPTTGFAIALYGAWALVDAPIGAPELLERHGIDPTNVRMIVETHGHEDHMGSAIAFLLGGWTTNASIMYVAAEPVYRTCVERLAALLDISLQAATALFARAFRGGVYRVQAGPVYTFCGAHWQFAWTVHPVPTMGFRVSCAPHGRSYALAYSSDTAGHRGALGMDAMAAAGLFDPRNDPFSVLVRGDESLVLWEAGGTHGDPIHVDVREWASMCATHGRTIPAAFMHTRMLPAECSTYALARPGWHVTLVPPPVRRSRQRRAA
ncbi:MBL fold metallo-hydrolase [Candidatus Uhrbacteria bacterium]|nr:MBL fold metallo-hydrolase [Candidatus Uhrbacteria bacterium]